MPNDNGLVRDFPYHSASFDFTSGKKKKKKKALCQPPKGGKQVN